MTLQRRTCTADDLLRMPDDGWRYELVEGELQHMAPAGYDRGRITYNLTISFGAYIKEHKLGIGFRAETGFILTRNPDTVRAPDMAFIAHDRANIPRPRRDSGWVRPIWSWKSSRLETFTWKSMGKWPAGCAQARAW